MKKETPLMTINSPNGRETPIEGAINGNAMHAIAPEATISTNFFRFFESDNDGICPAAFAFWLVR